MVTLENFYKTKEWKDLITVIKQARVQEDGFLYCEHCGNPIVKAYDCIAHHREELTEENVNNAFVALNPDNIVLVHHRCHNIIHNKLGYAVRQIYLVYGSPMAGKTTWVNSIRQPGDLIVDMDNVWQCISGLDRYQKPGRLNAVAFGIRDYLLDCVRTRLGRWQNAYIIGGYPLISERERICKTFGAREVFIDTSREVCMRRPEQDESRNHEEWEKYIADWWRRYHPPLCLIKSSDGRLLPGP